MKRLFALLFGVVLGCTAIAQPYIHGVVASGGGPTGNDTLTCTAAGIAYIASTDTAGIWEFSIYNNTAATQYVNFIDSDNNNITNSGGLRFEIISSNAIRLVNSNIGVIFATAASYVDDQVWYDIKIEENSTINEYFTGAAGTLLMSIKGGSFGASYVEVTEDTGNNPFTGNILSTSNYFVLDFDDGDRIAKVTINGTSYQYEDFTVGSGTYTGQ